MGVVDTGIVPNHVSFNDHGVPNLPFAKRQRRPCMFQSAFVANNKIIGGVSFNQQKKIIVDDGDKDEHRTNCASIAAGNSVHANVGNAQGIASGIASHAHLMVYKVYMVDIYNTNNILAAIDQTILDNVNVLSIFLGLSDENRYPKSFDEYSYAIGAFKATQERVLICMAASNDGPSEGSVKNTAPWILTVGASSIDRSFFVMVKLLKKYDILYGESANEKSESWKLELELVYPGLRGDPVAKSCYKKSLIFENLKNKIMICHYGAMSPIEKGMIVME